MFVRWRRLADDLVTGRGDGFTFAERAAAGGSQTVPFLKGKSAALALSRLHGETLRMRGFGDMLEMVKNLPLANPE